MTDEIMKMFCVFINECKIKIDSFDLCENYDKI